MILVIFEVNGKIKWKECDTLAIAENKVTQWSEEERKSFPHAEFKTIFYEAVKLPD